MAGSHVSLIVMPIVIAVVLAFWISLVYYATAHPRWKHHARRPRTDAAGGVFEATHGGRQLMPIWGEPGAIPQPRPAAAGESYQAADAQAADAQAADAQAVEQERAASAAGVSAGATASGSRPPTESGPTGSGWPRE